MGLESQICYPSVDQHPTYVLHGPGEVWPLHAVFIILQPFHLPVTPE